MLYRPDDIKHEANQTAWLIAQSEMLNAGRIRYLDFENLIAYLKAMAEANVDAFDAKLGILLKALNMFFDSPTAEAFAVVRQSRMEVTTLMKQDGKLSLYFHDDNFMESAWKRVITDFTPRAWLPKAPAKCPFTRDELLSVSFFPQAG